MFDFEFTSALSCSRLLLFAVVVVIVVVASAAASAAAAAALGTITGVIPTATITTFSSGERPVNEACGRARRRHKRCGSG